MRDRLGNRISVQLIKYVRLCVRSRISYGVQSIGNLDAMATPTFPLFCAITHLFIIEETEATQNHDRGDNGNKTG